MPGRKIAGSLSPRQCNSERWHDLTCARRGDAIVGTVAVGEQQTMTEQVTERLWVLGSIALVAVFFSLGLMVLLRPWLARYAMVQPNARSSHCRPTPQGGGIAVLVTTLVVAWGAIALSPVLLQNQGGHFLAVSAATALLAVVGTIDDLRSLSAAVRLAMQCIAVGVVLAALPVELQIVPQVPWAIERAGLFLAGLWFVNLVNFMDGIDWMTVAEVVPVTGAILLLGLAGVVAPLPTLVAAALLGAIVGFAPFNKPVAQIFLGDVGSLPIGLLLGWLLLRLAATGHLAAALILPLYYLADATITLVWRMARREPIWHAHRTHFYQRASDRGLTVLEIVTRVLLVNLVLAGLAFITVAAHNLVVSLAMLSAAAAIVCWLLAAFASGRQRG
jgi:UDP-N-acetylmuramyl pentapeptide phosphotransferase/UDP-N-acetylglucosamine-1-phosphate transferase